MDRSKVGIVIPALNEETSIGAVVTACLKYGNAIVVDDGSSDSTAKEARNAGAHVVVHPCNLGYDAALNSGFRMARTLNCEFALTLDADGQHDPQLLAQFIAGLVTGGDIVVGIRGRFQRVGESCFSIMTRWLYGIEDPLCGLKAYRMSVYVAQGYFDSYGSVGTELLQFAARRGCIIKQIPIPIFARKGVPRFGTAISANLKIFRALVLSLMKRLASPK